MLIRGKAKWAKVTGEPHWGYENKFKEWSIDVYPEDESLERLAAEGLSDKIKDKGAGKFITFKRRAIKSDGETENPPIRVVDHRGEPWNTKVKIGNGSIVNVNFAINEFKKDKGVAILSMQVWDLVKFEGGEFPTRDTDETAEGTSWVEDAA